jgi:hypothetical protein
LIFQSFLYREEMFNQENEDLESERFPSGQRGQTVNLLAMPSEVRILPSPPDLLLRDEVGWRMRTFPRRRRGMRFGDPDKVGGGGESEANRAHPPLSTRFIIER